MAPSVRGAFLKRSRSIDSEEAVGQKNVQMIQPLRLMPQRRDDFIRAARIILRAVRFEVL